MSAAADPAAEPAPVRPAPPLRIRSGGQSGVDRAALDFARERGVVLGGWCPAGGLAEDFSTPPGILARYPELTATPSADPRQRTAWNVRDADATVVITLDGSAPLSPGTELTLLCARLVFERPLLRVALSDPDAGDLLGAWLEDALRAAGAGGLEVNVAGPRESEAPGVHRRTLALLRQAWPRPSAPAPGSPPGPPGG
jgi:hypothetical protein